jgi:hypothetical protein
MKSITLKYIHCYIYKIFNRVSKLTIDERGTKWWQLPNCYLDREDDPAIEYNNGDKFWFINGQRHREDGPAIEWNDGFKSWFLNDVEYTEQEYKYEMRSRNLKKLL